MAKEELNRYRALCDQMRVLVRQARLVGEEGPPVGHQLIVCRDTACPLSKARWAKIIASLDGNLAAKWEDWSYFSDDTAVSRFFGNGEPTDTEDVTIVLERGYDLLAEYEDLDELPTDFIWDLPQVYRYSNDLAKHEYLLDLICRRTGEQRPNPEGFDGLEVIENRDLLLAIADEFESWVGERTWVGDLKWSNAGEKLKPENFTCQFRRIGNVWQLGYAINEGNDPIPLPHRIGFNRIKNLLQNPGRPFSPSQLILHDEKPNLAQFQRDVENTDEPDTPHNARHTQKVDDTVDDETIESVNEDIRTHENLLEMLRQSGKLEQMEEVEANLQSLLRYKNNNTFRGKSREFSTNGEKARKAVGNSISRAIALVATELPELAILLDDVKHEDGKWIYRPSREISWVF